MSKIAFTIDEAAESLGVSPRQIYRLPLPKRKAGGRTLILVEDLERYARGLPLASLPMAS
jgi:hypothetical protein